MRQSGIPYYMNSTLALINEQSRYAIIGHVFDRQLSDAHAQYTLARSAKATR